MMSFPGLGDVLPDSEDDLLEPEVEDENLHNLCFCCFSVVILYVVKLCPTLCNPMNDTTPGFPVLHYLPKFA